MSAVRENLLNLTPAAARARLEAFAASVGEPPYRARQVLPHLWSKPVASFAAMSDLPATFRAALDATFELPRLAIAGEQRSADGTRKFLFTLADGQQIEAVAIPDGKRMTLCVSSQAGCALQCAFCATGAMGFVRNLEPFEIACQLRELAFVPDPIRPTNVVFMGMGEPLMNWKAVDVVLTILNAPDGVGIGARHITLSTVGWLPGIEALERRPEQFRLAISIHAPSDALRATLMPVNTRFPLADVIARAARFSRRVTFEYVMLGGVNDAPSHADALASLARACGAFVNLIPLHPGGAMGFVPSPADRIATFAARLRSAGVEVAVRKSRGLDIAAACGQLRAERLRRRSPARADDDREVHEPACVGRYDHPRGRHRPRGGRPPLGVTGADADLGGVGLLRSAAEVDDVEPGVAEDASRSAREVARVGSVEHLDLHPRALGNDAARERRGNASATGPGHAAPREDPGGAADHERAGDQRNRRAARHRTAFQSSTVCGNTPFPSRSVHSSRIRTTWRKTASKSCGRSRARKARSSTAKVRPGSRKSAMNNARPVRSHDA